MYVHRRFILAYNTATVLYVTAAYLQIQFAEIHMDHFSHKQVSCTLHSEYKNKLQGNTYYIFITSNLGHKARFRPRVIDIVFIIST